jgi:hypothetical protein
VDWYAITCDSIAGAEASLDGVVLQWTEAIEPYGANFVEYRHVENPTLPALGLNYSPYMTLPMVFENAHSLVFKVRKHWLQEGVIYEFRMAHPFSSYTYRSNSLVVKTFDVAPRLISSPLVTATSASIHVMWTPPEYSSNLIGYIMQIYESPLQDPRRGATNETLIDELTLSLLQNSLSIDCAESTELPCLTPFTNYRIAVPAIRDDGTDDPFSSVASTKGDRSSFLAHVSCYPR